MGGLLEKDEEGIYKLSRLGHEASRILEEQEAGPDTKTKSSPFVALILVVIIISLTFYTLQNRSNGFGEAEYREESRGLLNSTLEIIYGIFNEQSVDRDSFTELVINIVDLQDRLSKLSEVGSPEFKAYAEAISEYNDVFTEMLKNSDDKFLVITVEKRQLIRDLHSLLLELEPLLQEE